MHTRRTVLAAIPSIALPSIQSPKAADIDIKIYISGIVKAMESRDGLSWEAHSEEDFILIRRKL